MTPAYLHDAIPRDGRGQPRRPRHPAHAHVARAQGVALALRVRRSTRSARRSTAASILRRRRGRADRRVAGARARDRAVALGALLPPALRRRRGRGGPAQRGARRGARAKRARAHLVDARRRAGTCCACASSAMGRDGSTSRACSSSSSAPTSTPRRRRRRTSATRTSGAAGSRAPAPASPTSSVCRSSARCSRASWSGSSRRPSVDEAESGETIVAQWEASKDFYVVLAGAVDVSIGPERIRRLGPGEFFGELAALDWGSGFGYPRLATVAAASDVRLLRVPC